jgi:hypothetical protein
MKSSLLLFSILMVISISCFSREPAPRPALLEAQIEIDGSVHEYKFVDIKASEDQRLSNKVWKWIPIEVNEGTELIEIKLDYKGNPKAAGHIWFNLYKLFPKGTDGSNVDKMKMIHETIKSDHGKDFQKSSYRVEAPSIYYISVKWEDYMNNNIEEMPFTMSIKDVSDSIKFPAAPDKNVTNLSLGDDYKEDEIIVSKNSNKDIHVWYSFELELPEGAPRLNVRLYYRDESGEDEYNSVEFKLYRVHLQTKNGELRETIDEIEGLHPGDDYFGDAEDDIIAKNLKPGKYYMKLTRTDDWGNAKKDKKWKFKVKVGYKGTKKDK